MNTMKRIFGPASLLAAVVAAPLAFASPDGDTPAPAAPSPCPPAGAAPAADAARDAAGRGAARRGDDRGFRARRHARFEARRAERLARMLGLTEAQRDDFRKAREAAAPVRTDLRAKIHALREEARKGERTEASRAATREAVKALVATAREQVAGDARRLLATITPEQRARLAEAAARRGKTLDDARLLRGIERMLLRPERGHRRAQADAK